jgi:orotidine-5'-phosphate decarboxylase
VSITEAAKWGLIASDIVAGFVGQSPPDADFSGWIQFTPGVNSASKSGDSKGQQYCSPAEAVLERGADIIIVGRGLIKSSDVVATAENYRSEGWTALTKRITNP